MPARIAELLGCTEAQVLTVIEDYRRIINDINAWDAIVERERPK